MREGVHKGGYRRGIPKGARPMGSIGVRRRGGLCGGVPQGIPVCEEGGMPKVEIPKGKGCQEGIPEGHIGWGYRRGYRRG